MSAGLVQAVVALLYAAPCFTMSWRLFAVWRAPMAVEGGRWVGRGTGVFILEFILLHAGIFLGTYAAGSANGITPLGAILMTAFYGLFAGALAIAFRSPSFLVSFLQLVAGRGVATLLGVAEQERQLLLAHSFVAMAIYFPLVVSSVYLPWPRLGITERIAAETRAPHSSGLWVEQPHRAIGPAAVYFLLLGVVEVGLMTWIDPRSIARL